MGKVQTINKVFRLKRGGKFNIPGLRDELEFINGQEFHIVLDVLYMNGFPLPMAMQTPIINWIFNNKFLFVEDTRNF